MKKTLLLIALSSLFFTNTSYSYEEECDPNYSGACIPLVSYDLDCKDIPYKNFWVVGTDVHRFDRDRDGLCCESR